MLKSMSLFAQYYIVVCNFHIITPAYSLHGSLKNNTIHSYDA